MAKKDHSLDNYDDLDFDDFDNFDDDFNDDGSDPSGTSRKPSSVIRTNLKQSAQMKFQDSRFRREVLKASLPQDYSAVLEDYDAVSKEVGEVWREQQKQWEKHRSGVKKAVKPYSDVIGKLGFKKLQAWAEADDRVSSGTPSDDEIDELKVQSILSGVFGDLQDQQTQQLTQLETARQEREDERYAEDVAEREVNAKRSIEGNSYLSKINTGISTIVDYTNKIDFQYKKRSLELQARLLVTQQRSLSALTNFRELAVKELQDIHKNTALPDYLKINNDEMIAKVFKEKMAENFSAPFNGVTSNLSKRMFAKIKTKMADWWETIGTVVDGANDANEGFSDGMMGDGTAWGGLKAMLGGAASDWVVNKPAEWAKNKLSPKIREYLEKNHKIAVQGSNLKTMGSQFGDMFNEALKKGETGNKFFDKIIDIFDLQGAAIGERNNLWNKKDLDLEKAVFMDNRFKLSVTDVIPAWLKKIYGEVFGLNNHGKVAPDLTWDFRAENFTTVQDANREAMDGLLSKDKIKKQVESIERWIDIIGDGASFSKKTRGFLKEWLIKKMRSSDAINPLLLLSDSISAPKDVRMELETVITASFRLTPKQVELAKGGSMFEIGKAIQQGNTYANDRLNRAADAAVDAKKQVRVFSEEDIIKLSMTPEGRRALVAAGVAMDDGNGQFIYNYDVDDKILNQFENTRSRERKINGRTVKDSVGYSRSRNVAFEGSGSYLTDDQREEMLDRQGYDDSEVKLKKDAKFGFGLEYLGYTDEKKMERQILRSLKQFDDPKDHPGYGRDFFLTKKGKLITSANKNFIALRRLHAPELHKRFSFASGGSIPSFASGGNNKLMAGVTKGQPGDEHLVKTHGGEFVVSHDAAKLNTKILAAINKYGAPLINADGSINSVYHKTFGFDKAKDFTKQAGKDFAVGAKNIKNEQAEIILKGLISNINFANPRPGLAKQLEEIANTSIPVEKRMPIALKLWSESQREEISNGGLMAYGKKLGRHGINLAAGKFDQWIDSDGTGTNIQIKDQLLKGARNLGGMAYRNVTNFASDIRDKAKNKLIDRQGTMDAVNKTLQEVENPKMFTLPIDLYFKGRGTPFVTARGFKRGEYVDQNTGALIRNPSQITGAIVDRNGQVVVTIDDIVDGDVVTRSGKPYRLLGMEETNRKYHSAKEYVANRYAIIASSQRMQDALQKGKDFRDKYLRDEAIDCYLRKDQITPVLRARIFKEGGYRDQATGNVLWTHHDITSQVIDGDGKVIVSAEELADGLFDVKGEHLKINKFKQVRNMVFRRGAETYNRYAAKHINRAKDFTLNSMSRMGEKMVGLNFDDDPIDVYVKGETSPRITAAMFKSKAMLDLKSGKPIKSHSGIQGPVVSAADAKGNQLISDEDIKTGLVDASGEDLYLPKMQSSLTRFGNYLKEAVLPKGKFGGLRNFITMSPEKRLEEMNKLLDKMQVAFDVYVKGEPLTPRLTKHGFENSKYISQKTGLAIKIPDFIDGPVLDLNGNVILSEEEIAKGLVTIDGKKVKIGVDFKEGGLINNLVGAGSIFGRIASKRALLLRSGDKAPDEPKEESKAERNILYTVKFKAKKGMALSPEAARINNRMFTTADVKGGMLVRVNYEDGKSSTEIVDDVEDIDASTWLKSAMSNVLTDGINFGAVLTMGGYIIDDEGKVIKIASHNAKKKAKPIKLDATAAVPFKGAFGGALDKIFDKLGLKNRLGSWQQQREDKANAKTDDGKTEDKKEKKDSWIGKLIKKLTLPLTAMFGGIASGIGALKASLLGAVSWLGQSLISKSLLGGMGSFLGRAGIGKALAAGAITYGGIKAFNYLDGNATGASSYGANDQNSAYANLDTTSKIMNLSDAAGAPEGKTSKGFMETMTSNPELASALAMGAMMMPGAVKGVGKGAWWLGKKAVAGTGKLMHWGGKKMAGLAGRTALAGGKAVAGKAPGMLGTLGKVVGGTWRATGGGLGAAARAAPLLAGLGGLLIPAALIAGAAVGGYMLGKGLMKLWNNHKNPWNRFRMAQYGFNHNNEELMNKIAQIEGIASNLVSINGDNQPSLKTDEKAMVEILKICGIYDDQGQLIKEEEARLQPFAIWFKERFLRVFSSYLRSLKKMRGKAEMIDLQTLNRQEQLKLLDETHFKSLTLSPYVVLHSPFKDPAETEMDATDVDVIYRKLKNKIETAKDIKDGEVKDLSKVKNEDGLDQPTAKPLPKDATSEDKLKHQLDKQLDGMTPAQTDAKSMVDKANAAVKYQADAATLLTKAHNAEIKTATEQATKDSESLFSKAISGLQEKFTNFLSASRTAASKIFSGTAGGLVDGLGDAAGIATGSFGNSIFSGGQAALDSLKGSNKDAEKNLVSLAMKSGVTDPKEITMLLAQASHESGGFKHSRELGNDAYFAKYNGRKDLGNGPNDGARYKGRGWIQLTGKANYAAFSKWAGIDAVSNPEMVEKEPYASLATIWYWTQSHNMKKFGRKAAQSGDVTNATKAVNGGTNGLKDRQEKYAKYSGMIGNDINAYLGKLGGTATTSGAGGKMGGAGAGGSTGGSSTPPSYMMTGGGTKAGGGTTGGGIVGASMANLDAKYGNKGANGATAPQATGSINVAGSADWDFDKITKAALTNKLPKASGKCAVYVRKALSAGDLRGKIQKQFGGKLGHAFEYNAKLPKLGFNRVYSGSMLKGFQLMKGDVVVFDRGVYGSDNKAGGGWVYGHVAIWTGGNWVSDFIQSSIYPHSKYASQGIPFTIFRANGIAKERVTECKIPGDEDFGKPLLQSTPTSATAQKKQEAASQVTPEAVKVNNTVNSLNNSGATSAVPQSAPQPSNPLDPANNVQVVDLLGKQLKVQEQMLSVLKDIAKGTLSAQTGSDAQSRPGVTTPNMSAIRNEKSQFSDVKNPVSVLKPV